MSGWDIAFTGDWPALLVLAGAAASAVLAWAFYRCKREALTPRSLKVLGWLRTLAIAVVAVFMLQPVLRLSRTEAAHTGVAVLVDTSQSMSIKDAVGGMSRLEAGLTLLNREPYNLLARLSKDQRVRLFSFSSSTAELADAGRLAQLSADGSSTALGDGLLDVVHQVGREDLSAVIVLSDGVSTSGADAEEAARTLGVSVFPVALGGRVGETGLFCDLSIARVPQERQATVNTTAQVKVQIGHRGLARFAEGEREVEMRMEEEGALLAARKVQLPGEDGATEVDLEWVPKRIGLHSVRVSVPVLPGETVVENNARTFTIEVTDPRIRVLIVEGVARSEYRFLRRVLESDPNLEVTSVIKVSHSKFLVQGVQPGVDLSRGLPAGQEDYAKFDVVILGDIARDEFAAVQLEYLKKFVDGGGALLALGGYHAFGAGGYADSPLADVLPVTMGGVADGHAEKQFVPVLTAEGAAHPALQGCEDFFKSNPERVALDGANRVTGLKPGALALLAHPTERAGDRPMPVLAVQSYGSGRVMAMTADTTWKWKFQVEAEGLESPYYRFWRQSARWLAGRKVQEEAPDQLVSAWSPKAQYEAGAPVSLKARVRGRDHQPKDDAVVEVTLSYPAPVTVRAPDGTEKAESGATVRLDPVPLSMGEYQAAWRPPAGGLYKASVVGRDEAGELGTAHFEFVVSQATSEFDRVDVDEDVLQAVAARTGGTSHTLATASRIPQELQERRTLVVRRRELSLWNAPWLFTVFVTCVTIEWVLRKRKNLN